MNINPREELQQISLLPLLLYIIRKRKALVSSMIDKDGVDWIGLHDEEGFGPKGEYRGFPNAIQG